MNFDKVRGTHLGNELIVSTSQLDHTLCYQNPLLLTGQRKYLLLHKGGPLKHELETSLLNPTET